MRNCGRGLTLYRRKTTVRGVWLNGFGKKSDDNVCLDIYITVGTRLAGRVATTIPGEGAVIFTRQPEQGIGQVGARIARPHYHIPPCRVTASRVPTVTYIFSGHYNLQFSRYRPTHFAGKYFPIQPGKPATTITHYELRITHSTPNS